VACVGTLVLTLAVGAIIVAIVARGAQRRLRGRMRGTPRLRCAVHYSTAWLHLLTLGALIMVAAPLSRIAAAAGWGRWPVSVVRIPAVLSGVLGMAMWWFWCVRLGQAMPAESRSTVTRYFVLWAPLWGLVLGGGAVYGAWVGAAPLAEALHLQW